MVCRCTCSYSVRITCVEFHICFQPIPYAFTCTVEARVKFNNIRSVYNDHATVLAFSFRACLSLVFKSFIFICLLSVHFAFVYRLFSNCFCCVVLNAHGVISQSFLLCSEKESGAHQLPEAAHPVPSFEGCS